MRVVLLTLLFAGASATYTWRVNSIIKDSCKQYPPSLNCAGSFLSTYKVCDTDGREFANMCMFYKAYCSHETYSDEPMNCRMIRRGRKTSEGIAPDSAICQSLAKCDCPVHWKIRPIFRCGSDRRLYMSKCDWFTAKCEESDLTIETDMAKCLLPRPAGALKDGEDGDAGEKNAQAEIETETETGESEDMLERMFPAFNVTVQPNRAVCMRVRTPCPSEWMESDFTACGSDGFVYTTRCDAERARCLRRVSMTIITSPQPCTQH